jgi:hypothetical protein
MGTSSNEKEIGEMKERTSGDSERVDRDEAVVAEGPGDVTCRRRVAMSADHTESEKQKENAIRI